MNPRAPNAAEVLSLDADEADPVWAAFERAPVAKEPETEEQRRLVEVAKRGPFVSATIVSAQVASRGDHGN
jgi:hypothetical protein